MNNLTKAFKGFFQALKTKPFTSKAQSEGVAVTAWVPMNHEISSATREVHRNTNEDNYFEARPEKDSDFSRVIFRAGFDRGYVMADHVPATLESFTDAAKSLPNWISYDSKNDILSIHGRQYSAAMFGEAGFLAPPGTLLRVEGHHPDCVTLYKVDQPTVNEPDYAWPTIADFEKHVGFPASPGFTAGWNMAKTKLSDLCLRADDTTTPSHKNHGDI